MSTSSLNPEMENFTPTTQNSLSHPLDKIGFSLFERFCSKWKTGQIEITLPDQSQKIVGSGQGRIEKMTVHNWKFFRTILFKSDIGFGESYTDGLWDSTQLHSLLQLFVHNRPVADDHQSGLSFLTEPLERLGHFLRRNTLSGSQKNISAHYDLSNDLYQKFLDPRMQYSCAIYGVGENLEQAQERKLRSLLKKLQIQPGMTLLEVGSGWGGLAIMAAQEFGAHVHSITLSEEQLKYAEREAAKKGVDHLIQFELLDYRKLSQTYDRIVSIEMIEAVGHENMPTYFSTLQKALKPGGLFVLQAITMPDAFYEQYRKSCDWLQKYIFPGAVVPSLSYIQSIASKAGLISYFGENIGQHYAQTLSDWHDKFLSKWSEIKELKNTNGHDFDTNFKRTWVYYLKYCEAGFRQNYLGTWQVVFGHLGDQNIQFENLQKFNFERKN